MSIVDCTDYCPADDGSKKCQFYAGHMQCTKPWRVRCIKALVKRPAETTFEELSTHPEFFEISKRISFRTANGGAVTASPMKDRKVITSLVSEMVTKPVSFSQMSCWGQCPRMWWLKYRKRIKPCLSMHYFEVGKAAHAGIQHWFLTGEKKESMDLVRSWIGVDVDDKSPQHFTARLAGVEGVLRAWIKEVGFRPEGKVHLERHLFHPKFPFHGYADAMAGRTVYEFKFYGGKLHIGELKHLSQVGLYIDAGRCDDGFVFQFMKPNIQSFFFRSGETYNDLVKRVYNSVLARPQEFWTVEQVEKDSSYLSDFLTDLSVLSSRTSEPWNTDRFPRRTGQCRSGFMECSMLPICKAEGRFDPTKYFVEGPNEKSVQEEKHETPD